MRRRWHCTSLCAHRQHPTFQLRTRARARREKWSKDLRESASAAEESAARICVRVHVRSIYLAETRFRVTARSRSAAQWCSLRGVHCIPIYGESDETMYGFLYLIIWRKLNVGLGFVNSVSFCRTPLCVRAVLRRMNNSREETLNYECLGNFVLTYTRTVLF